MDVHPGPHLARNPASPAPTRPTGKGEAARSARRTQQLIDLSKPYAVLLSGILHHLPDERDPVGVTQVFRDAMRSGSYLLVSNFLDDDHPHARQAEQAITAGFGTGRFRTWAPQRDYFEGLELVEPGFVYANDWRADDTTPRDSNWHAFYCGGIGHKP